MATGSPKYWGVIGLATYSTLPGRSIQAERAAVGSETSNIRIIECNALLSRDFEVGEEDFL